MADQIRSGIIGAGFIGTVHAQAVRAAGGGSPESPATPRDDGHLP
jgi:predicted dehydrogenase